MSDKLYCLDTDKTLYGEYCLLHEFSNEESLKNHINSGGKLYTKNCFEINKSSPLVLSYLKDGNNKFKIVPHFTYFEVVKYDDSEYGKVTEIVRYNESICSTKINDIINNYLKGVK